MHGKIRESHFIGWKCSELLAASGTHMERDYIFGINPRLISLYDIRDDDPIDIVQQ